MNLKTYREGDTIEINLTWDLKPGEFPIAYLWGPTDNEPAFRRQIGTKQTITPRRTGDTFHLDCPVPAGTEPGLWELHHVDLLYSVTGMKDARKITTITQPDVPAFAVIIERAPITKASAVPPIKKVE